MVAIAYFTLVDNQQSRGYVHLFHGDLDAAAADFEAVRPRSERLGNGFHLGFDGAGRAWVALARGDPTSAVTAARVGQRAARRTGESNSDAAATFILCFALADLGRPDEGLGELAVGEELFARRPGWLTEVAMAAARPYVLSAVEAPSGKVRPVEFVAAARVSSRTIDATQRQRAGLQPAPSVT